MAKRKLTEQQLVDKLEEIAMDDRNRAAQIAAISKLREIEAGESVGDGFAALDQLAPSNVTSLRTKQA